jgi:hypothetical protein
MRQIDLANAVIPVQHTDFYPEFDAATWTKEEHYGLLQRMYRNWYNEQQDKVAQETGTEPRYWPEDEYIELDGNGPPKYWPAQNAAYAKKVAEGVHGDAPLGAGERAEGVCVGQASAAAQAAEATRKRENPWQFPPPASAPEPTPYISPNACCDGYREKFPQKYMQENTDLPSEEKSQPVNSDSVTNEGNDEKSPKCNARTIEEYRREFPEPSLDEGADEAFAEEAYKPPYETSEERNARIDANLARARYCAAHPEEFPDLYPGFASPQPTPAAETAPLPVETPQPAAETPCPSAETPPGPPWDPYNRDWVKFYDSQGNRVKELPRPT